MVLPHNDEEARLTKGYSKTKTHHFMSQESYKHIHLPTSVLFLSRLPEGATQVYVHRLFLNHTFYSNRIHMFPSGKHMAFVEPNSAQEAAEALVALQQDTCRWAPPSCGLLSPRQTLLRS